MEHPIINTATVSERVGEWLYRQPLFSAQVKGCRLNESYILLMLSEVYNVKIFALVLEIHF